MNAHAHNRRIPPPHGLFSLARRVRGERGLRDTRAAHGPSHPSHSSPAPGVNANESRLLRHGCAALLATSAAFSDVKLPAVISDGMVLQQGMQVAIWGTADPGEQVTVTFRDQKPTATADANGKWRVELKPLEPGGPFPMTVEGSNKISLHDILVGEVWICSGQSNMAFSVSRSTNAEKDTAEADYPMIRLFKAPQVVGDEPQDDIDATWQICRPETVGPFSATGYFFGRDIHKALRVPVGLIGTNWGGTAAEAWTSRPTLERNPALQPILDRWDQVLANYPTAVKQHQVKQHQERLAKWEETAKQARAEGKPVPRRPRAPAGPGSSRTPGGLYNGMIAPFINYAIGGAIWYQGEANAGRAYEYRKLLPAMIRDWRRSWGQGPFPFYIVQLPNFREIKPEPGDSDWAELREAQFMTTSLPNVGIAVTIELGEANDIHPKNKAPVGHRLALAALANVYDQNVVHSGPVCKSMAVEGHGIRIQFKHVAGGLVVKDADRLKGFAIAGSDGKFVWAIARIDGSSVVLSSPLVRQPVAVRYAWADNPVCNLFNDAGLPAAPFRTDDWPGITEKRP